ncbi:hypothetical protein ACIRL2_51090, partial [Embleya sp. NPDC127516]|uniref:hypothetical protein n=1 Tax=Embleya sp. NPDC127516 TaxID=3363990 RepID=UPI0038139943
VEESQRAVWSFAPFERVGPLRFGMTHDRAMAAVDGVLRAVGTSGDGRGRVTQADLWPVRGPAGSRISGAAVKRISGAAVNLYYDESIGLAAIAIDARRGPQVHLDDIPLVGRTPSRLEDAFCDHLTARGHQVRYSRDVDPRAPELGVVVRVQRAGDHVLTRPVLLARPTPAAPEPTPSRTPSPRPR